MKDYTRQFGYSLVVVIFIVVIIGILGMIGAQEIFKTTIEDAQEKEMFLTKTAKLVEVYDNAPLAKAVRAGNTAMVKLALNAGANPNTRTSSGRTVLHRAVSRGLVDIANMLLEYGADVNATDPKKITPLHLAAGNGHVDLVAMLIGYGANINIRNEEGNTPLAMAMQGLGAADPADKANRQKYEDTVGLLRGRGAKK